MMGLVAVCALLLAPLREGGMHLRQAGIMEIGRSDSLVRRLVCLSRREKLFVLFLLAISLSLSLVFAFTPVCASFLRCTVVRSFLVDATAVHCALVAS